MKSIKVLYSVILAFIVLKNELCLAADAAGDDPDHPRGPDVDNPNVRIRTGCNFYEIEEYGAKPFSQLKKDNDPCTITLDERGDTFMYACDGPSEPVDCPVHVKTEEGTIDFRTLFNSGDIKNKTDEFDDNPYVYHCATGAYTRPFSVSCVCNKADGTKETMILKSSFEISGIIGSLLLVAVMMMNI